MHIHVVIYTSSYVVVCGPDIATVIYPTYYG